MFATSVSALTPPVNLWGFAKINGIETLDETPVNVYGTCFNEQTDLIISGKTSFENGYYDLNIPMDDPNTVKDEGCS